MLSTVWNLHCISYNWVGPSKSRAFLKSLEIVKITLGGLFLLVVLWSFGIAFFTAEMMQRQGVFRAPGKGAVHQWVPRKDYGARTAALFSSEVGPDYWGRFVWAATSTYQIHPGGCQLMHGESGPWESCQERAAAGNLEVCGGMSPLSCCWSSSAELLGGGRLDQDISKLQESEP